MSRKVHSSTNRTALFGWCALALLAIMLLAVPKIADAGGRDRYVDRNFGFSFSKPHFAPSDELDLTTVAITLAASPSGAFAPNINVIVQNVETNLDAFAQRQLQELKSIGWEVVEQSHRQIGGRSALRTRARGSLQGLDVEFLAVAIIQNEKKAFVLTCTTTRDQFPEYEAEFNRVAASFVVSEKPQ
jgi:hypothetical protein